MIEAEQPDGYKFEAAPGGSSFRQKSLVVYKDEKRGDCVKCWRPAPHRSRNRLGCEPADKAGVCCCAAAIRLLAAMPGLDGLRRSFASHWRRDAVTHIRDSGRATAHMDRAKHLRAISFDGDMTLWDFEKVMRHSLACCLAELRKRLPGPATDELTIERMAEIRNAVAEELRGKTVNLEDIRFQAFRRTVDAVGSIDDALAADLNTLYRKHRFEDLELYPDVMPALDALQPHFALGLVSNGNSYPERCGLAGRFQSVLFSQDVGVEKPAPGIFLAACEKAGCEPHELMHVGDSLETDVAGANVHFTAVGLKAHAERWHKSLMAVYGK